MFADLSLHVSHFDTMLHTGAIKPSQALAVTGLCFSGALASAAVVDPLALQICIAASVVLTTACKCNTLLLKVHVKLVLDIASADCMHGCYCVLCTDTPLLKPICFLKNMIAAGVIAAAIGAGGLAAGAGPAAAAPAALLVFCGTVS
jgi:4-hydroxybenzoate polyprenyltransferase